MRILVLTLATIVFAFGGLIGSVHIADAGPKRDRATCSKIVKNNPGYLTGSCKCYCGRECGAAIRRCMQGDSV
jgi:hypothetical protein